LTSVDSESSPTSFPGIELTLLQAALEPNSNFVSRRNSKRDTVLRFVSKLCSSCCIPQARPPHLTPPQCLARVTLAGNVCNVPKSAFLEVIRPFPCRACMLPDVVLHFCCQGWRNQWSHSSVLLSSAAHVYAHLSILNAVPPRPGSSCSPSKGFLSSRPSLLCMSDPRSFRMARAAIAARIGSHLEVRHSRR
jgi:hypothetical protein